MSKELGYMWFICKSKGSFQFHLQEQSIPKCTEKLVVDIYYFVLNYSQLLQATRSAFICDIFLFIFCLWRLLFPLHLLIQIGGFPIMEPQSFATNCTYKIGNVPKLVRIPNILLLQSARQKDVESSVTDSKYF